MAAHSAEQPLDPDLYEVIPEPPAAAPESSVDGPSVEFYGERFRVNPEVSEFALMEFAEAASSGLDGDMMEGLAALLRFTTECIHPDERVRFRSHARKNRATSEALTQVLTQQPSERPTVAPADSSDGRTNTEPKSESSSIASVTAFPGRPDRQMVERMVRAV